MNIKEKMMRKKVKRKKKFLYTEFILGKIFLNSGSMWPFSRIFI